MLETELAAVKAATKRADAAKKTADTAKKTNAAAESNHVEESEWRNQHMMRRLDRLEEEQRHRDKKPRKHKHRHDSIASDADSFNSAKKILKATSKMVAQNNKSQALQVNNVYLID